jgi:hypothetical protein
VAAPFRTFQALFDAVPLDALMLVPVVAGAAAGGMLGFTSVARAHQDHLDRVPAFRAAVALHAATASCPKHDLVLVDGSAHRPAECHGRMLIEPRPRHVAARWRSGGYAPSPARVDAGGAGEVGSGS